MRNARKEISTRDQENGARSQNRELGVQEYRGDRISHEHPGRIDRDERVDRAQLHATERPDDQVKGDDQAEHDADSEAFLPRTWRQAREDEMLVLRHARHRSEASRAPLDELIVGHRQCFVPALNHIRHARRRRLDPLLAKSTERSTSDGLVAMSGAFSQE